ENHPRPFQSIKSALPAMMRFLNPASRLLLCQVSLVHGQSFQDLSASCLLKSCCSRPFSTQKRVIHYHPCSQSYGTERLSDLKKRSKATSSITGLKRLRQTGKHRRSVKSGSHRIWRIH